MHICLTLMNRKQEFGHAGEELATQFLRQKGHTILERNWRAGKDEIDIISQIDSFLVITEVKTRSSNHFMNPEDAVDDRKQKCLMRAAEQYIFESKVDKELRFDIISVISNSGEQAVFHIEDAFYATLE